MQGSSPSEAPRIGELTEIGAGATGEVRLGVLAAPFAGLAAGEQVAVKDLRPELADDPRARETFRREAEIGTTIEHPGLVRVLHFQEDGESARLVMRYVPGRTLREVLEESGPLPEPLARSVIEQLAGGLAALHAAGYVHGDVKPENLRLDERGRAVLMDLGFARSIQVETDAQPGSLAYLAPECARGEPTTPASDVFALGLVLYELLTGWHPVVDPLRGTPTSVAYAGISSTIPLRTSIETPGADSLLAAVATARFSPPSRFVPQLSPFIDVLALEMLARQPHLRPASSDLAVRLAAGERSPWWRERLASSSDIRRGGTASPEARHLTPLVGRTEALRALHERYEGSLGPAATEEERAARGGAVWLIGAEGSGKSRLMSEFAARVRAGVTPPIYLYGRCSPFDEERPGAPFLQMLQRWLRLPPGSMPGERERALLAESLPPTLADALQEALVPDVENENPALQVALARWLESVGGDRPVIVFLDDVNYADEGTLAVLLTLADRLAGGRTLLVLGLRQDAEPRTPETFERMRERLRVRARSTEIELGALAEKDVLELVNSLFHRSVPRKRVAQVLWTHSHGNPGFVVEILRDLADRGKIHPRSRSDPSFVLAVPPEELPVPASLSRAIEERLATLAPEDRRWLERVAVAGGRIRPEFLASTWGASESEIGEVLARLVRAGWLASVGDRFRFARPALREAAYRGIPVRLRKRYHAEAADALAARGRGLPLDDSFQRAFHLRAAGRRNELLEILSPLVTVLLRRGQPQRVHSLARWGIEALDELKHRTPERDRQRVEMLEAAADAADRLGYRKAEREWLDRLADLDIDAEKAPDVLARVYLLHGRYAISTGQYGLARGMLRNAVDLSERADDKELRSEALRRLSAVQTHVGELTEARKLARRALELAAHGPQRAVTQLQLAHVDLLEDELEPALRGVDRALALLRSHLHTWTLPGVQAACHMLRGRIYRLAGRPRRALGSMNRAVRLSRQSGERRLQMEATARLGGLLLDVDLGEEAEANLREALLVANEIEDRRGQALAGLWLGILLWEHEDPESKILLSRVARLAADMGLSRAEALARAVQARAARASGRAREAFDRSQRAARLVENHGAELADRIVILGTHVRVLEDAGEASPSRDLRRKLERTIRRVNRRIKNEVMRERHGLAAARLLAATLDAGTLVYPRARLPGIGDDADRPA